MASPSMPGARFVVIETELVLGGFEAFLDRPTMAFDFRQRFDRRSTRRPCREEGEIAVDDLATDQKSACPDLAVERLGATPEGRKELIGFQTGTRESAQSWKELLVELKARGLSIAPEVAVGDGALGFWKALDETFPTTRHQRCWLHKTLNVLDKFPKSVQPNAHKDLREIWLAPDRATAETAATTFAEKYAPKYYKAVECLIKDRETLLTFFDFPADHWDHLRTTNPIESVFATVRHRTVRMKGALSQDTARLMVFKLVMVASKSWRRLQGQNQLPKVIKGVTFRDGIEVAPEAESAA